jgi:hypothetical protein
MRPLPQIRRAKEHPAITPPVSGVLLARIALFSVGAWTLGCAEGGAGSVAPPPPSPPSIQVVITPNTSSVLFGETLSFSASVSNSPYKSVNWSVDGIPGGSSQIGTITPGGVYSAPANLPATAAVQITATSNADSSKYASATATITSDLTVTLSPGNSAVELGAANRTPAFVGALPLHRAQRRAERWTPTGTILPQKSCRLTRQQQSRRQAWRILPSNPLLPSPSPAASLSVSRLPQT